MPFVNVVRKILPPKNELKSGRFWLKHIHWVAPLAATLLMLTWTYGIHAPGIRKILHENHGLFALEAEIESLELAFSEQQVLDFSIRSKDAEIFLLRNTGEAELVLDTIEEKATLLGWNSRFGDGPEYSYQTSSESPLRYSCYRFELLPSSRAEAGHDSYSKLLELLNHVDKLEKHIDVMRLSIKTEGELIKQVVMLLRMAVRV